MEKSSNFTFFTKKDLGMVLQHRHTHTHTHKRDDTHSQTQAIADGLASLEISHNKAGEADEDLFLQIQKETEAVNESRKALGVHRCSAWLLPSLSPPRVLQSKSLCRECEMQLQHRTAPVGKAARPPCSRDGNNSRQIIRITRRRRRRSGNRMYI